METFYIQDYTKQYPKFKIETIKKEESYWEFKVYEIQSWSLEGTPLELNQEVYALFHIKFDGCTNVLFGEGNGDYIHLCGEGSWRNHIWLMEKLLRVGKEMFEGFE